MSQSEISRTRLSSRRKVGSYGVEIQEPGRGQCTCRLCFLHLRLHCSQAILRALMRRCCVGVKPWRCIPLAWSDKLLTMALLGLSSLWCRRADALRDSLAQQFGVTVDDDQREWWVGQRKVPFWHATVSASVPAPVPASGPGWLGFPVLTASSLLHTLMRLAWQSRPQIQRAARRRTPPGHLGYV